jgi:hypothetical protein
VLGEPLRLHISPTCLVCLIVAVAELGLPAFIGELIVAAVQSLGAKIDMTECGRVGRAKFIIISDFAESVESQLSCWGHKLGEFVRGKCAEGLNNKTVSAGSQDISTFLALQGASSNRSGMGPAKRFIPTQRWTL